MNMGDGPYSIDYPTYLQYVGLFQYYDTNRDGYLTRFEAMAILATSRLDQSVLQYIWNLADCDRDNLWNYREFCVGYHLMICVSQRGLPLLSYLPPELWDFLRSNAFMPVVTTPPILATAPILASTSSIQAPVSMPFYVPPVGSHIIIQNGPYNMNPMPMSISVPNQAHVPYPPYIEGMICIQSGVSGNMSSSVNIRELGGFRQDMQQCQCDQCHRGYSNPSNGCICNTCNQLRVHVNEQGTYSCQATHSNTVSHNVSNPSYHSGINSITTTTTANNNNNSDNNNNNNNNNNNSYTSQSSSHAKELIDLIDHDDDDTIQSINNNRIDKKNTYTSNLSECIICMTSPANTTLVHTATGIGHLCCCYNCALILKRQNATCPKCRQSIDSIVKTYTE